MGGRGASRCLSAVTTAANRPPKRAHWSQPRTWPSTLSRVGGARSPSRWSDNRARTSPQRSPATSGPVSIEASVPQGRGEAKPRAVEARLHGGEGQAEELGHVGAVEPLEVSQGEHFAVVRGKRRQRARTARSSARSITASASSAPQPAASPRASRLSNREGSPARRRWRRCAALGAMATIQPRAPSSPAAHDHQREERDAYGDAHSAVDGAFVGAEEFSHGSPRWTTGGCSCRRRREPRRPPKDSPAPIIFPFRAAPAPRARRTTRRTRRGTPAEPTPARLPLV